MENEVGESVPWTPLARQRAFHYLTNSATDRAIWGGKMNTSVPVLADAGNKYPGKVFNSMTWKALPSILGIRDRIALYGGVVAEGFDIPCGPGNLLFGVSVRQNIGRVETPAAQPLETPELVKTIATHVDEGDAHSSRHAALSLVGRQRRTASRPHQAH